MVHDPRDVAGLLRDELEQRRTSGYDVGELERALDAADAGGSGGPVDHGPLFDIAANSTRSGSWRYEEPPVWEITPTGSTTSRRRAPPPDLADRVHGAWLGRCAGCLLGKPIEGWPAPAIRAFLEDVATWPPTDYVPAPEPWPAGYPAPKPSWRTATRGRIRGMPRDDDIDYTILGLHLLEDHGRAFTTEDVANELLDHLPFTQVFTAERVAYANLVAGLPPAHAAARRNPYREWIGAIIRADIFGFVSPGDPAAAAAMALRDARLTHEANGVYGARWAAAAIACAMGGAGPRAVVAAGLEHVPPRSRLAEALCDVVALHDGGASWPVAIEELRGRYGHYHWVHVIPNAVAIAAAILWADGDFGRSIGLAVGAGFDTDSAGATAGSIAGAMVGAAAIPAHWTEPLGDTIRSAIGGFDGVSILGLAERTLRLVEPPEMTA